MNNEFVIRRHNAKRAGMHDDLHLDGLSFAIPKGLPKSSGTRVLAIKTTYHTPEQARFEGTIPEGQYGAGVSTVLDQGDLTFLEHKPEHIYFLLQGDVYRGYYHLRHWVGNKYLLWKAQ